MKLSLKRKQTTSLSVGQYRLYVCVRERQTERRRKTERKKERDREKEKKIERKTDRKIESKRWRGR